VYIGENPELFSALTRDAYTASTRNPIIDSTEYLKYEDEVKALFIDENGLLV